MDSDSTPSQPPDPPAAEPSLRWRAGSKAVMAFVGSMSRIFMFGVNSLEVHGLDGFLETLDRRKDVGSRERGLITGISPSRQSVSSR